MLLVQLLVHAFYVTCLTLLDVAMDAIPRAYGTGVSNDESDPLALLDHEIFIAKESPHFL
jgi:hypothetical protein